MYVLNHGGRLVIEGDGIALAAPPRWHSRTILPADARRSWNAVACRSGGGASLAVAAGPSSSRDVNIPFGSERRSLWILPPAPAATPRRLTPASGASDELPMWSRNGRWLLFVRTTAHGSYLGHGQLYALNPASGRIIGPIAPIGRAGSYYGDYGWENVLDWHRP